MLRSKPIIVFLGTYPPRECGIATFTQDLLTGSQKILEDRAVCKVCAMNISTFDTYEYPPEVEWQMDQTSKKEHEAFARKLNNNGLIAGVMLQHEYGIYGGEYGQNILYFMRLCTKPIIVTFHTVLPDPDEKMKSITKEIITIAKGIVVLTESSKRILETVYPEAVGKVSVIPHGIHATPFSDSARYKTKLKLNKSFVLSTFGLLSRGKGIEYVIQSLPKIIKKHPNVKYLVLGETHPAVQREEGEKYRIELLKLVTKLKLNKYVKFYDQYFSVPTLLFFLKATDIYVSTSINPNQAVSGTLSYALGTGRAVVSTTFPQSKELINDQTGKLVPAMDPQAYSEAILSLMEDKHKLKDMNKFAYDTTRHMEWGNVAKDYMQLLSIYSPLIRTIEPVLPPLKLNHLKRMTDDFGLFQFANVANPNKEFGYTLDDNARALIVCSWMAWYGFKGRVSSLVKIYLSFLEHCQDDQGTFINYVAYTDKKETTQNNKEDIEESNARALWALSEIMGNEELSLNLRKRARKMFLLALPHYQDVEHQRSKAFLIKALANVRKQFDKKHNIIPLMKKYATELADSLDRNSTDTWHWFDSYLAYNNAILPESLFIAGNALKNDRFLTAGKVALEFLTDETFRDDFYFPIGHTDWYRKGQTRSAFDQQPEDPASMILALVSAYCITKNEEYRHMAYKCFTWFLGNNMLAISLYNYKTGGCYDGLHPDRVNQNQGAESLVSYLTARIAMLELN